MNVQFEDRALAGSPSPDRRARRVSTPAVQPHPPDPSSSSRLPRAAGHCINRREVIEASNDLAGGSRDVCRARPQLAFALRASGAEVHRQAAAAQSGQPQAFSLGTHTADEIALAVDHLRQSGLIVRRSGREEAAMPLLASWVSCNLDHGSGADEQLSHLRIRRLALGLVLTTLMFAIYYSWFQLSMQDVTPVEYDGCRYSVRYPQRGVETVTVYLSRQCTTVGKRAPLACRRRAAPSRALEISGAIFPMPCTAQPVTPTALRPASS